MKINNSKKTNEVSIVYEDNGSINVNIFNNEILKGIAGSFDNNFRELEKISGSKIYFRGNFISIKGDKAANEKVKDAINYLVDRFKSDKKIDKNDIITSLNNEMNKDTQNESPIHFLDGVIKTPKRSVIPRSKKQKDYVKALKTNQIIMSLGPAGTGKTYLAVAVALTMLLEKKVERIILSRPAVEAGERLGFLPGDMKEKIDPYLKPIYDALYQMMPADRVEKKIQSGEIEIAPLAFMRGRTFTNSFVIVDEAQNTTAVQMKMVLTRIGEGSRMVINGDLSQVDLPTGQTSGLKESKKILSKIKDINVTYLDANDVIRHPIVSKIIKAYDEFNKN